MKTTDIRVVIYTLLPLAAFALPWMQYTDGVVTIQVNVEAALATIVVGIASVGGIYAKWGKR